MARQPVLVGANPAAQLVGEGGEPTGFASIWVVDWSVTGPGRAFVLWTPTMSRVVATDADLGAWLVADFVRHFGEVAGRQFEPVEEVGDVAVDLDLGRGLQASAGDMEIELDDVAAPSLVDVDGVELGGTTYRLVNVTAPCRAARVRVGGEHLPGAPAVGGSDDEPTSTAFLAVAETWLS